MPNHCYYLAISFTNHLYLYSYIYSLAMHLRYSSAPLVIIIIITKHNRHLLCFIWFNQLLNEIHTYVSMLKPDYVHLHAHTHVHKLAVGHLYSPTHLDTYRDGEMEASEHSKEGDRHGRHDEHSGVHQLHEDKHHGE